MENLKVKVTTKQESKEVQELFFELGCYIDYPKKCLDDAVILFSESCGLLTYSSTETYINDGTPYKEITIPQLRDLVVLKRNNKNDATHSADGESGLAVMLGGVWYGYNFNEKKWESWVDDDEYKLKDLKPIEKEMKEYLNKTTYEYKLASSKPDGEWVCIPKGAEIYVYFEEFDGHVFYKDGFSEVWHDGYWCDDMSDYIEYCKKEGIVLWQRPTHPEPLPFIDDEPQSLNDQYAEIEQVRQDVINNPNHYTSGGIECLDAMQAMLGRDEFIGFLRGNVFKYNWRYQLKNGVEDLKKAQFYQNKLIELESID